jgi:hypothetical protein
VKIGFFAQGEGEHLYIARNLIRSVQEKMPGCDIYQLTDGETRILDGAKGIRIGGDMPMAVRRISHHAGLDGEWLFIDSDCVILKDVSHVFDDPVFDIALTDRKGSIWEKSFYGMVMPYNMGVTFSRSPSFWLAVKSLLLELPESAQRWEGDQRVVCEMVRRGYPAKILPGKVYNFTPEKRDDSVAHAAIVHYKGKRKHWIGDLWNKSSMTEA